MLSAGSVSAEKSTENQQTKKINSFARSCINHTRICKAVFDYKNICISLLPKAVQTVPKTNRIIL